MPEISRRTAIALITGSILVPTQAALADLPRVSVSKDPNCGCCAGWVEHLRTAGFATDVSEIADLTGLKARLGVPEALASCHTAEVGGYVVEGHVPARAVQRLLTEKPQARGLAVPGMPIGSPGMETPGAADEEYDVVLFGAFGQRVYARFKGTKELPVQR